MTKEIAIKELEQYLKEDTIYQAYLNKVENTVVSDFDEFCVRHCESIAVVLSELNKKCNCGKITKE